MSKRIKVVAVSGNVKQPSRTVTLVQAILAELSNHLSIDVHLIELADIVDQYGPVSDPSLLPQSVVQHLHAVEAADLLIVASPVYRASYTGLFKHFFDFVNHESLFNVPVLLAATGGSERHALVIDHQLRPLFSFFQALTLPIGVFATEADLQGYRVSSQALQNRIALAIERALPLLPSAAVVSPRPVAEPAGAA